ncbi:MAG: radical SAM protein [Verrucomicrobiota bacterium]
MPTKNKPEKSASEYDNRVIRKLEELRANGEALLPVKVCPRYQRLIDHEIEELGTTGGPLYNVAYPKPERFDLFAPGEVGNFVDDSGHMPAGLENVLIYRYPQKALFLTTHACLGHCQYCFRPDIAGGVNSHNISPQILDKVCDFLRQHPQIKEIILSGGDPLVCAEDRLEYAIQRLMSVPSVKYCRLHSRAPVYQPEKLTTRLIGIFEEYDIRFVTHIVHPYELDEEATAPLKKMRRRGIMMYNQFPMLRGINDHPAAVMELAYRCTEVGIQMLSMFIADPIKYGAVYRLRLARNFAIADEIFFHGEAWISNFRVCQDTPIGKVKREHITSYDPDNNLYTFSRQGHSVSYQDIPATFDIPTSLSTLLYNGGEHIDLSWWPEKYFHRPDKTPEHHQ